VPEVIATTRRDKGDRMRLSWDTRKSLAVVFKVPAWAGFAYLAIASLVAWVSMFGLLGFLLGGTLVSDLALPFIIKARTGRWPTLALVILAASLACSAASCCSTPSPPTSVRAIDPAGRSSALLPGGP
jgi:hypothetical protein